MFGIYFNVIKILLVQQLLSKRSIGRATSSLPCTYTFQVAYQANNQCPPNSVETGFPDEGDGVTKAEMISQIDLLTSTVAEMKTKNEELMAVVTSIQSSVLNTGTNYIRWGRTVCPMHSSKIYEGFAARSSGSNSGGGINFLCLHNDPEWSEHDTINTGHPGDRLHGVEYVINGKPSLKYHDVPCVSCNAENKAQMIMIPARKSCDEGWTMEYRGLLVASGYDGSSKTSYICLDESPEEVPGEGEDKTTLTEIKVVQSRCSPNYGLHCPPYINGYDIVCVVCTK